MHQNMLTPPKAPPRDVLNKLKNEYTEFDLRGAARGKQFRGGHVHSIIKRKRVRDEKLKEKYPEVRSDFYLDIYDKSIMIKI